MQQADLFGEDPPPAAVQPLPPLVLQEHPVEGYRGRTLVNAQQASLTVAFAVDFETAGERLTKSAAGGKYAAVPYGMPQPQAVHIICEQLRKQSSSAATVLNIAGNGLYTFKAKLGMSQDAVNAWVFEVIRHVHQAQPLARIRSGGQTGADTAGLVAALALKIPALGLYPKGFLRRGPTGKDYTSTREGLQDELLHMARQLPQA